MKQYFLFLLPIPIGFRITKTGGVQVMLISTAPASRIMEYSHADFPCTKLFISASIGISAYIYTFNAGCDIYCSSAETYHYCLVLSMCFQADALPWPDHSCSLQYFNDIGILAI